MVDGGGGLQDFSVNPRPLGFGFLGPGLDKNTDYIIQQVAADKEHGIDFTAVFACVG